jgi:sensor domain CHASE-containing protein
MKNYFSVYKARIPAFRGFVVFLLIAVLTQTLAYQRYVIIRNKRQNEVLRELNVVKGRLENGLNNALSASKILAFIVEKYGVPADFNSIAKNILESNGYIDALQLTKEGVITNIYPLKGSEIVIGYDILKDPRTNKEAYKAIEKKELFFAGPLKLKQGGLGIVGRLPIFVGDHFEGFSVVIIKLETLLKVAGISSSQNEHSFISYRRSILQVLKGNTFCRYFRLMTKTLHLFRFLRVNGS